MRPWLGPVAVVLVASLYPLVEVELDHAAPPRQTMQFTQREFYRAYQGDENTGTSLTWSWARGAQLDSVPRRDLAGLGIVCTRDEYECTSGWKRRGWLVVGIAPLRPSALADTLRSRLDSLLMRPPTDSLRIHGLPQVIDQLDYQLLHTSRLTIVAVGSDPDQLAARWNDGAHLVLAARLDAYRISWPRDTLPGEEPFYRVSADPLPPSLYLSRAQAAAVRDSSGYDRRLFRVTIGIGGGWLPRVLAVAPDPSPATLADSVRLYQSLMP